MRPFLAAFIFLFLIVVPARAFATVQISNISDISLPPWGIGDGPVSAHIDICIANIQLPITDNYAVTISSPGGYVLNAAGGQTIPYSLYWEDSGAGSLGSSNGAQLSDNVKSSGFQNANVLSALCLLGLSGPNARLNLKITQAAMTAALAGNYSGTITIVISPN